MSFLDLAVRPPPAPTLAFDSVRLRPAALDDFAVWAALREESRLHLTAWEPAWRPEDMTLSAFRQRLKGYARDTRRGVSLPLLIVRRADDALVGGVSLTNIRYGASRSAGLGYWIGAPFVRRGYARAALGAVLAHAFTEMALNRVEAACQPANRASRKLLAAAGFAEEGYAKAYLHINGAWRDHLLFALTAADFRRNGAGLA